MIITRKELEKVANELSYHIDRYIYLNENNTNDNKAIKDMVMKCDNAYYLIYYINNHFLIFMNKYKKYVHYINV